MIYDAYDAFSLIGCLCAHARESTLYKGETVISVIVGGESGVGEGARPSASSPVFSSRVDLLISNQRLSIAFFMKLQHIGPDHGRENALQGNTKVTKGPKIAQR